MINETRKAFHQELDDLKTDVLRMGALVTESIQRGTDALLAGDLQAAQSVIDDDDFLDNLSIEMEDTVIRLMALQQPMAGDLRALIANLKINAEIERSGDLMVNVAKGTRRMYGVEVTPRLRGIIEQMSEEASRLFRLAIDAYAESNAGLATALDDIDDRLDQLHKDYIQEIFETQRETEMDIQVAVQLALIGRYYERVGDHAVNIGERIRFMVDGVMPEHTGALRAQSRIANERLDSSSAEPRPSSEPTDRLSAGEGADDNE